MLQDDYIVYKCVNNSGMVAEIQFGKLTTELKTMVSILNDVVSDSIKKYIIIYNDNIAQVKVRVFSTNPNSKRYVDAICSYEFLLGYDFEIIKKGVLDTIKLAIEKTVENMEIKK